MGASDLLNELMEYYKMGLSELAKKIGYDKAALSRVVTGITQNPRPILYRKLEEHLNIKIDSLNFTFEPNEKNNVKMIELPIIYQKHFMGDDMVRIQANAFGKRLVPYYKSLNTFIILADRVYMTSRIHDGDELIIDLDQKLLEGDIVIGRLKNGNDFIGRYKTKGNIVIIEFDNPDYSNIIANKEEFNYIIPITMTMQRLKQ